MFMCVRAARIGFGLFISRFLMRPTEFTIFSGTANPALARLIGHELGTRGGNCVLDRYPDGEVAVQILESVRRKEVFLMQPTSPPANEHLIELLALADASRRAGATRITAIVPYFGYGRADRRHGAREPIMARMVADLLEVVGIDHVVTVDPHTAQIEGFFRAPVDSISAVPTLCRALQGRLPPAIVVVAPDAGRVAMATRYAQCLGAPVVVLHKRRKRYRDRGDPRGRRSVRPAVPDHRRPDLDGWHHRGEYRRASGSGRTARIHGGGHACAACGECARETEPPRRS